MDPAKDPGLRPPGEAVMVDADGLPALFEALRGRGYTVVGPTVRDGAIVVAELASAAELPFGWGVEAEAGRYRLRERADTAAFGHSAGPQSWKSVLHPARARLWHRSRATWPAVCRSGPRGTGTDRLPVRDRAGDARVRKCRVN